MDFDKEKINIFNAEDEKTENFSNTQNLIINYLIYAYRIFNVKKIIFLPRDEHTCYHDGLNICIMQLVNCRFGFWFDTIFHDD